MNLETPASRQRLHRAALLLGILLASALARAGDADILREAKTRAREAAGNFDFTAAVNAYGEALSRIEMDIFREQLRRDQALVSGAQAAFERMLAYLRSGPVPAARVKPGAKGSYARASRESITLIVPGGRGRPPVELLRRWGRMPIAEVAALAALPVAYKDAAGLKNLAALCVVIGETDAAARAVQRALRADSSIAQDFGRMGSGMDAALRDARALGLKDELARIRRQVRRGYKTRAKEALAGFLVRHGASPAFSAVKNEVTRLCARLGLATAPAAEPNAAASEPDEPADSSAAQPAPASGAGTDEPPEPDAKIIEVDCPICSGSGMIKEMGCTACKREGRVDDRLKNWTCEVCKGTRVVEAKCSVCKGTGQLSRGSRRVACPRCRGKGYFPCGWCKGKGQIKVPNPNVARGEVIDCPTCGGDGFQKNVTCRRCGGRKTLKYRDGRWILPVDCPFCSGTGKTHPFCKVCKGMGTVGKAPNLFPCGTCFGTGNAHISCRTCKGKGWIAVKKK